MERLGPDNFSTLQMKGHVLHRARAHLKVPGCSLVWNALLTKKLPMFLSRLNEINGGCEKILPVSGSFWSNLKFFRMMDFTDFRLAILIFAKTRFCSHIKFIGRCLHSKVIPKGFRSNFHASSLSHSNQYLRQIQCAQNSFSRKIMRITIRAMCQKRDDLDKQILQCRSELSKICPAILVQSIRTKIQEVNSKLFNHLHQI